MSSEYLKEFLSTIAFLIPLLALVWKGALLTARLSTLENTVKEKVKELNNGARQMETKIDKEEQETEASIKQLMTMLNDMQKTIVRIETKIDMNEGKNGTKRS